MGTFQIKTDDGTFNIQADSPENALAIMDHYQKTSYTGPADKNGVPEGMVFDPATNRMVDAKALAQHEVDGGSWAGDAIRGMPFVGQYADELAGWLTSSNDTKNHPNESQTIQTEVARQAQDQFAKNNPKTALASKVAVGLTTIPLAAEALPAVPATAGLFTRTAASAGLGGALGATEGAISGYGQGEGDDRLDQAKKGAEWGGATGAVLGGVMPLATDMLSAGARNIMDRFTVNKQVNDLGITRPAADTLSRTLQADDTLGQPGMQRLQKAGEDAMLADAGDTASGLLDTTIQKSGTAGRIASAGVQKRAAEASGKLSGTMDLLFGKPPGIDTAAQDIYSKSAAARKAAYDLAYSKPIDYASDAGQGIEDVFSRTPDSILGPAIKRANDTMQVNGLKNQQIMASIADDGSVSFKRMPNVVQADYLKRALNDIAESSKDARGILSPQGVDASKLARDLRSSLADAVPEYAAASKLGGDTIEEKNALELGYRLLKPSTTREEVSTAVQGMTDAERKQLALGLRQQIDDAMANVTQAISDPNVDAREAAKALKDMSSRSAREKLSAALGDQKANMLFTQLDKAQAAISLKANVASNSRTFARQQTAKSIDEAVQGDSPWQRFKEGRPWETGKSLWQAFTGANPAAQQAQQDQIYSDIAKVLTGPRGQDAQVALQRLLDAYKTGNLNQDQAQKIGRILYGSVALPAYQTVMPLTALKKGN